MYYRLLLILCAYLVAWMRTMFSSTIYLLSA